MILTFGALITNWQVHNLKGQESKKNRFLFLYFSFLDSWNASLCLFEYESLIFLCFLSYFNLLYNGKFKLNKTQRRRNTFLKWYQAQYLVVLIACRAHDRSACLIIYQSGLTWNVSGSLRSLEPLESSREGGPWPVTWYRYSLNQMELTSGIAGPMCCSRKETCKCFWVYRNWWSHSYILRRTFTCRVISYMNKKKGE